MSAFDKVMHLLGIGAGTIAVLGASGGVAVPAWLTIVAAGVQTAVQLSTGPVKKYSSMAQKPGQDSEELK